MPETPTIIYKTALALGISASDLRRLARSAPHRYKVFYIPKRSGTGMRLIAQPAKEVKAVQRWLVANEFTLLPRHTSATAYGEGCSILKNAQRHLRNRFLLKMDFADFFPSIKDSDLRQHLTKHLPGHYTEQEIDFLCRFTLWHPPASASLELCIGAPSSPILSNSIMYDFDVALCAHCSRVGVTYSRYADDLAFSTPHQSSLVHMKQFVAELVSGLRYPRLRINERKTVFTSKKFRRTVTGLVLSSQGAISLGRERKREIRAMAHRFILRKLTPDECAKLRGLIAFAEGIEPAFVRRLEVHYSLDRINEIRGA